MNLVNLLDLVRHQARQAASPASTYLNDPESRRSHEAARRGLIWCGRAAQVDPQHSLLRHRRPAAFFAVATFGIERLDQRERSLPLCERCMAC